MVTAGVSWGHALLATITNDDLVWLILLLLAVLLVLAIAGRIRRP